LSELRVPIEVKEAAKNSRLVFFVGTGISMNKGAPNWSGFAKNVLNQLRENGIINYGFIEQLKNLQPKRQLSIARILADKNDEKIDFKEAIEPKKTSNSRIYEYIAKISACYVTTNYDTFLHTMHKNPFEDEKEHNITKRDPIVSLSEIKEGILKKDKVIHLHGSYSNGNDDLVVTTRDYIEHYRKDNVEKFLNELFGGNYTIVFLGYSLEEIEILDYLLMKTDGKENANSEANENNRFWLQGIYRHQEGAYEAISEYYSKVFGINILNFYLDDNEYEELTNILKKWADVINGYCLPATDKKRALDEVLDNE